MGRFKSIFFTFALALTALTAFGQQQPPPPSRARVDLKADVGHLLRRGDTTIQVLVGNVVFHHNGAIIVCDSALRYSESYVECFKNVIVQKDSTFIYGDRADYNGATNLANIYAPLVKTVDKDMTMYSYNLQFNTNTNVGTYTQGGTIAQKDNLMESSNANYYTNTRDIFFVGRVLMRNDDYTISSDSMGYNFDSEVTTFYKKARIWTRDSSYLEARRGNYDRKTDTYFCEEDSYVLTKEQQMWADSITYNKGQELVYLYQNLQMLDETQRMLSFGDFGIYYGNEKNALLTRRPSLIGYEENPTRDSVFMRADTLWVFTVPIPDSLRKGYIDSLAITAPADSLTTEAKETTEPDETGDASGDVQATAPVVQQASLSPKEQRAERRRERKERKKKRAPAAEQPSVMPLDSDSIPPPSQIVHPPVEALPEPNPDSLSEKSAGWSEVTDSLIQSGPEESVGKAQETTASVIPPSVREAAEEIQVAAPESAVLLPKADIPPKQEEADTMQRLIRGYRNVKIFRSDFQAVCDSVAGFSIDSSLHMHIAPILWSDSSQITSEITHVYSRNSRLDKADFEGNPIMAQQVNDSLFNQVNGKLMFAYFRNNEIDHLDVIGNARTYYYIEDDGTGDVTAFLVAESADITFSFDSSKMERITWRTDPVWSIFPMDKIPDTQEQRLKDFKWQPERKPEKSEVFDRTIRPSRREELGDFTTPEFEITSNIELYKRNAIRSNMWRERNEKPWIRIEEFRQAP
ncbi:MAG: hypothetical protein LBU80_02295 [Rikenellaceae bacterium]|nr:hypothetical protein [Rikenellaceae bacterium]